MSNIHTSHIVRRASRRCARFAMLPLLMAALLFSGRPAFAQEFISPAMDSLIRSGIRLSIQQKYEQALALFTQMEREHADHPAGYFFHAATLQTRMMDYERYDEEEQFFALLDTTVRLATAAIRRDAKNAWAHFFLGGAYGYLAFYQAKQSRYLHAFQFGSKSIRALNKAAKLDTALYDVHLGLGSYDYHRSRLSRHLSWMPFVRDGRQQAIEMLRQAMRKSRYSRYSALNGLCWILLEEGRAAEGLTLIEQALREFPNSRVFLWCAAKLTAKLNRHRQAIGYYNRILASFAAEKVSSPYNEVICRKNLAILYGKLNDREAAARECAKIAQMHLEAPTRNRLKKALETVSETCDAAGEATF